MKRHKHRHVSHQYAGGYMLSPQFLGFLPQQVDTPTGSETGVGDGSTDTGSGDASGQP